ncbi:unnamed protein product [Heligmosomoides polygyrus]|uniref:DUF1758 domain-containing protein n=1 Tax=Heligmosomoides polygyrus TaxID=6339 RepID=A0A183GS36_HELPZ|nr:unnamed protein product [Heligmosomoides polygyrus]
MPTIGSVKAQITKAANALRALIQATDESMFHPSLYCNNTGMSLLELQKQKANVATTMCRVQQLLSRLEERWGRAEEYASEQTVSDKESEILDEFRAHWEANACDQVVEEAQLLLARLQGALVVVDTPIPSNDRSANANTIEATEKKPKQINTQEVPAKESSEIDILIGMDHYWSVISLNNNEKLPSGLVQSQTKLGPILSGFTNPSSQRVFTTSVEFEDNDESMDTMVRRLCALDSADMEEDHEADASEIIQQYYNTVRVINGLIHVRFPWKVKYPHLPDNKALALRRLESQYDKFRTDNKV